MRRQCRMMTAHPSLTAGRADGGPVFDPPTLVRPLRIWILAVYSGGPDDDGCVRWEKRARIRSPSRGGLFSLPVPTSRRRWLRGGGASQQCSGRDGLDWAVVVITVHEKAASFLMRAHHWSLHARILKEYEVVMGCQGYITARRNYYEMRP
ncbi:hypothetical protein LZ30DRAFT_311422 [Colletotrichum cereale]|nr:hypothetical protein LZ30DRAFT_311422 [Colletotrichum cereale]